MVSGHVKSSIQTRRFVAHPVNGTRLDPGASPSAFRTVCKGCVRKPSVTAL